VEADRAAKAGREGPRIIEPAADDEQRQPLPFDCIAELEDARANDAARGAAVIQFFHGDVSDSAVRRAVSGAGNRTLIQENTRAQLGKRPAATCNGFHGQGR